MGDNDPSLNGPLNRLYYHIEGATPPASLEHFDAGAGQHHRVAHVWAGVAGVAVLAAAIGGLVVGLSGHRTAVPGPATSHRPSTTAGAPTASASPTAAAFPNFQPVSLTAISESQYWVLGYDGHTCQPCKPMLLHTLDGGSTFEEINAPPVVLRPTGQETVAGIRFADASDGYVYGSALWVTHDGGVQWQQVSLGGSVPQLEPGAGGFVYAVVQQNCQLYGTGCAHEVKRSAASGDAWSTLAVAANAAGGAEVIGVHGTSLWVMHFGSGAALDVSRDAGMTFSAAAFPCDPSLGGSLDPVSDSALWAFCVTGNEGGPLMSSDGGNTWSGQHGGFSNDGMVAGISDTTAFASNGVATLQVTHDGGATYNTVLGQQPSGVVSWMGFTDASVGYLLSGLNPPDMQLWRTTDGGAHWAQVKFGG